MFVDVVKGREGKAIRMGILSASYRVSATKKNANNFRKITITPFLKVTRAKLYS